MNTRLGLFLTLLLPLSAAAAQKPQIAVEEFQLANGMRWLLFEQHDSPTVAAGWVARVGSVNERPGITGISHFFEHMMFKGTHVVGTKDIEADLKLIEEQEKVRGGDAGGDGGPAGEAPAGRDRRPREARELDAPLPGAGGALRRARASSRRRRSSRTTSTQLYTSNGGEGLNAATYPDKTDVLRARPREQAGALGLARVGPAR